MLWSARGANRAQRAGADHPSRFSGGYKRQFGELPSETIMRQRNQRLPSEPDAPLARARLERAPATA